MKIILTNIILLITLMMNATSQNVCDTLPFINCEANKIVVNNATGRIINSSEGMIRDDK